MKHNNIISKVFENTQNSYKYYWWLSILEISFEDQKKEISFEEIVFKIISKLWYPVNYFKISFGIIDQCSKHVRDIKTNYLLDENIKEKELYDFLIKNKSSDILHRIINELTRYVPFRFIRPWYSNETRGLADSKVNKKILLLQDQSCPYIIDIDSSKIILNDDWFEYIKVHYPMLKAHSKFELLKYLEKENPNVSGLSKKLEKPNKRNLVNQKKYWNDFIRKEKSNKEIFTNRPLHKIEQISIDHFFPWSFFTHDLIWNLHPVEKVINSSKNNCLPAEKYFTPFFKLQYEFCQYLLIEEKRKPLENYFNFYKCSSYELKIMDKEKFIGTLSSFYYPQLEKAKNMGFDSGWILN